MSFMLSIRLEATLCKENVVATDAPIELHHLAGGRLTD